jgi:hypothetical protein
MATTKICNHCDKSKPITSFYKMSASKDGLQPKCKECCKVVNHNFREAKPEYQLEWQKTNHTKWLEYVTNWAKKNIRANNSRSQIYYIVNPENKIYVGSTQTRFSNRKSAHKIHYRDKSAHIPSLHHSFDLYGFDNHKWVVLDMAGTDRETLRTIEYTMINHFNKLGMSLNVRLK